MRSNIRYQRHFLLNANRGEWHYGTACRLEAILSPPPDVSTYSPLFPPDPPLLILRFLSDLSLLILFLLLPFVFCLLFLFSPPDLYFISSSSCSSFFRFFFLISSSRVFVVPFSPPFSYCLPGCFLISVASPLPYSINARYSISLSSVSRVTYAMAISRNKFVFVKGP